MFSGARTRAATRQQLSPPSPHAGLSHAPLAGSRRHAPTESGLRNQDTQLPERRVSGPALESASGAIRKAGSNPIGFHFRPVLSDAATLACGYPRYGVEERIHLYGLPQQIVGSLAKACGQQIRCCVSRDDDHRQAALRVW